MTRLLRIAVLVGLAAGLAACSSGGDNSFLRLGNLAKVALMPSEAEPQPELTREQLNQIPYATISLAFGEEPGKSYLVPLADNNGHLTYLAQNGRGIVMYGGAVSATKSLGSDLRATRYAPGDPIANPTPLAEWPASVYRDYQYAQRDGEEFSITMSCSFQRLAAETVTIAELDFDLVRVAEVCTNSKRQVTNTYWVEADSGAIWKSIQWLGPHIQIATIEIIRPYGG